MLVLSRKERESIIITLVGERITLTVQECRGSRVRLSFHAPAEVTIHRAEVQERIDALLAGKDGGT